jgi:hypothetical protein
MSFKEMVLRLQESGLDPRQRHTFDLYVYLPTKKATDTLKKIGCGLGFTVEVIPGAKRRAWFCIATKTSPPPGHLLPGFWRDYIAVIAAAGELFDHLARKQGGCLHGWEVDIHKP